MESMIGAGGAGAGGGSAGGARRCRRRGRAAGADDTDPRSLDDRIAPSRSYLPPDERSACTKCGLQKKAFWLSTHQFDGPSFLSHVVQRKHAAWKTMFCAATRSAK